MKKLIILLVIMVYVIPVTSWAIDPEKYSIGMDYDTIKKTIFDNFNVVIGFDNEFIKAQDRKSKGVLKVTFKEGKAVTIDIWDVTDKPFMKYTKSLKSLLTTNAKVISGRTSKNTDSFGQSYLWKLPDITVELGMFYHKKNKEVFFQIKKTKVTE